LRFLDNAGARIVGAARPARPPRTTLGRWRPAFVAAARRRAPAHGMLAVPAGRVRAGRGRAPASAVIPSPRKAGRC